MLCMFWVMTVNSPSVLMISSQSSCLRRCDALALLAVKLSGSKLEKRTINEHYYFSYNIQ